MCLTKLPCPHWLAMAVTVVLCIKVVVVANSVVVGFGAVLTPRSPGVGAVVGHRVPAESRHRGRDGGDQASFNQRALAFAASLSGLNEDASSLRRKCDLLVRRAARPAAGRAPAHSMMRIS